MEETHRVVGAQYGHRRPEANAPGRGGDGGEQHRSRGVDVAGSVVLADAEDIQPHGLGVPRLLDEQSDGLAVVEDAAGVRRDLPERIQTEGEWRCRHGVLLRWFPEGGPPERCGSSMCLIQQVSLDMIDTSNKEATSGE